MKKKLYLLLLETILLFETFLLSGHGRIFSDGKTDQQELRQNFILIQNSEQYCFQEEKLSFD